MISLGCFFRAGQTQMHSPRLYPGTVWLILAVTLLISGCRSGDDDGLFAEIQTPKGMIVIKLDFDRAPMTVANFVGLAEGTIENEAFEFGTPFYDGSGFHRVAPNHVIQGGKANSDRSDSPGYTIPNEIHPNLGHGRAGMVGMASSGPHTASSQFYITLGDRSYLDGNYAVFGEIVEGMEVVRAIEPDDAIEHIRIIRVGRQARAFQTDNESFRALSDQVTQRVMAEEETTRLAQKEFVSEHWPNAIVTEEGWSYQILEEGEGALPMPGSRLSIRYTGRTFAGLHFSSRGGEGKPWFRVPEDNPGDRFDFNSGESSVNPVVDAAISGMRRGETRLVISPWGLGYGIGGYYSPSGSDERRFVISPNSMLVYKIEVVKCLETSPDPCTG